ncbi:type VI secretion system-associated FHA domain protein [Xanthobacter sediminis]
MLRARLTVTSEQGHGLGPLATHDFDAAGGIIGRSSTCDWRLPDPTHTLSSRHAEIRFNGQGFVVVDLSTNGVYVNTTDAPLGRGNAAVLVSGDLVYIGTYVITVELVRAAPPATPGRPAADPLPPPRSAPMGPPVGAPLMAPVAARPTLPPQGYSTPTRGMRDPLAALDGESVLQEADNPFSDLGIGQRDGEGTDTGRRALLGDRGPGDLISPGRGRPFLGSGLPPAAPAAPRPMPADPLFSAPPPPVAPPPPPPARAEAPAAIGAAAIPPNFLDELSILIPRLVDAGGAAATPPPPAAPVPAPVIPAPPASLDDPEEMVTLLRMRGKAKAPPPAAAPQPFSARPAPIEAAPARIPAQPLIPPQPFAPAPAPAPPFIPATALEPVQPLAPAQPLIPPQAFPPPQPFAPAQPLVPPQAFPPLQSFAPAPPFAPPPSPAPAPQAGRTTEAALWDLLGVDAARLSPAERGRLLGEVAALLRTLVQGVLALRDTQRRLAGDLHLEAPRRAGADNPFETAATPEEALARAVGDRNLDPQGIGRPGAAAAAQAVLDEMRLREAAAMEAVQATVAGLLDRLSPAAIAFDVEEEGPSGGIFAKKADKVKLWNRYLMMHERLVDGLDVVSSEQMGREFARSYARQAQAPRREEP